jgi:hypothetical protein
LRTRPVRRGSNWRAGEFVGQHLAPLLPNPPHITAGEVVAHTAK